MYGNARAQKGNPLRVASSPLRFGRPPFIGISSLIGALPAPVFISISRRVVSSVGRRKKKRTCRVCAAAKFGCGAGRATKARVLSFTTQINRQISQSTNQPIKVSIRFSLHSKPRLSYEEKESDSKYGRSPFSKPFGASSSIVSLTSLRCDLFRSLHPT